MKTRSILTLSAIALVSLTACGGSNATPTTTADATTIVAAGGSATAKAIFTDGDVIFAQGMIPHHEQAIEMADQALNPAAGASEVIKGLATRIKAAQDPEIKQMKAMLASWGKPVEMTMAGHDMSKMDGMMSAKDMEDLGKLKGAAFDKSWAAMMIKHHEGALTMAKTVQKDGSNPDVAKLAAAVISGQQAEIDIMKPLAA